MAFCYRQGHIYTGKGMKQTKDGLFYRARSRQELGSVKLLRMDNSLHNCKIDKLIDVVKRHSIYRLNPNWYIYKVIKI